MKVKEGDEMARRKEYKVKSERLYYGVQYRRNSESRWFWNSFASKEKAEDFYNRVLNDSQPDDKILYTFRSLPRDNEITYEEKRQSPFPPPGYELTYEEAMK